MMNIPKGTLSFLLLTANTLHHGYVSGYTISPAQISSSFTGRRIQSTSFPQKTKYQSFQKNELIMYNSSNDPPNKKPQSFEESGSSVSVWSALANTERWISKSLANYEQKPGAGDTSTNENKGSSNPYARKEVSYVCETNDSLELLTADIFRRLREMRQSGESHAKTEKDRNRALGDKFKPRTFRQTVVVIMPFCNDIVESFTVFDKLISSINEARRNARDYVTDTSIETLDDEDEDFTDIMDWSTSVNMAPLHPKYGELTREQKLAQELEEEKSGEVDLNYKEFIEKRNKARRSPYPTVVVEVRSIPSMVRPMDQGPVGRGPGLESRGVEASSESSSKVTRADLNKLEALFGQSASFAHPEETKDTTNGSMEDDFYNAIGKTGIQELTFANPINLAQTWIADNDPLFQPDTSTVTVNSNKQVDEAYEFLFYSIGMNLNMNERNEKAGFVENNQKVRNYLVMPNFLSSSATSFEKFSRQVSSMIDSIPSLKNKLTVSTFHPEHIEKEKRSPKPIFVMEWDLKK